MDRPLRIGVDVDDVLNNLLDCWIEIWNEESGQNVEPADCTNWDLHKLIPNEKEYEQFIEIPTRPEFYERLEPIPLAQIILKELVNSGADVYILTGTYTQQHLMKEQWIKKHYPYIPESNIIYAPMGTKHLFNVDVMIEDSPIGIENFTCQVLLLNKEYNKDLDYKNKTNIHRMSSWLIIRDTFAEKYNLVPLEDSEEIHEYFRNKGKKEDLTNLADGSLLSKLLQCKTENDFSELLNPLITKTYDFGYSAALADMADKIKSMFPES